MVCVSGRSLPRFSSSVSFCAPWVAESHSFFHHFDYLLIGRKENRDEDDRDHSGRWQPATARDEGEFVICSRMVEGEAGNAIHSSRTRILVIAVAMPRESEGQIDAFDRV